MLEPVLAAKTIESIGLGPFSGTGKLISGKTGNRHLLRRYRCSGDRVRVGEADHPERERLVDSGDNAGTAGP